MKKLILFCIFGILNFALPKEDKGDSGMKQFILTWLNLKLLDIVLALLALNKPSHI